MDDVTNSGAIAPLRSEQGHTGPQQIEAAAELALDNGYKPLRLVMSGKSKLVLYAGPHLAEIDERVEPFAWVHRITLERGKSGLREVSRRWARLPTAASSETLLHTWDEASNQNAAEAGLKYRAFDSPEEKERIFASAYRWKEKLQPFLEPMSQETFDRIFTDWRDARDKANATGRYVQNPDLHIPLIYFKAYGRMQAVSLVGDSEALLWHLAPNDASRDLVRKTFIAPYQNKAQAKITFEQSCAKRLPWRLEAHLPNKNEALFFVSDSMAIYHTEVNDETPLQSWWGRFSKTLRGDHGLWMADGVMSAAGCMVLDAMLGAGRPWCKAPIALVEPSATNTDSQAQPGDEDEAPKPCYAVPRG